MPEPDVLADNGAAAEGNQLFLGALGWIMGHELAHHVLKHHELRSGLPADHKAQELDADDQATTWMKGGHTADPARKLGARPPPLEMELERRALSMLVGMIWVAQFELGPLGESATHPDVVAWLHAMVERLALATDSFAAEILAHLVKVLIDPEGVWPANPEAPYAIDAATVAMIRLNRRINAG